MVRALLLVIVMKASPGVLLAWFAVGVCGAACGGVTLQPSDGGSKAGHAGGGTTGSVGGSGGAGGSVGAPCDTFDEASCKMMGDHCEAYYCPGCSGQRFVGCDVPGGDDTCPAVDCLAPCSALDEAACGTRQDCTSQHCNVCPNAQPTFAGCTTLDAPPVECPAEECVEASCNLLDAASCQARSDCQWYVCPSCGGESFFGCVATGGNEACPEFACVPPPAACNVLDQASCTARSDCQAYYCSACGGGQTFVGCGAPGGETACPAIECVQACGTIMASDYDQSCATDADCVAEPEGDFCGVNTCTNCRNAVVSVKAQMQYESDLASKISTPSICPCPSGPTAVCNNGRCAIE